MSPKFYSCLWVIFFVAAGILWIAGALNIYAVVVLGFIAFGLVFMGMMCVLPSAVSHPAPKSPQLPQTERAFKPLPTKPEKTVGGFSTYRSA